MRRNIRQLRRPDEARADQPLRRESAAERLRHLRKTVQESAATCQASDDSPESVGKAGLQVGL